MHTTVLFFYKQKTAYEIYQCDWSSDVCSSDLLLSDISYGADTRCRLPKGVTACILPPKSELPPRTQGRSLMSAGRGVVAVALVLVVPRSGAGAAPAIVPPSERGTIQAERA